MFTLSADLVRLRMADAKDGSDAKHCHTRVYWKDCNMYAPAEIPQAAVPRHILMRNSEVFIN